MKLAKQKVIALSNEKNSCNCQISIKLRKVHKEDENCESNKSKTDFEKEFVEKIAKFIEVSTRTKEQSRA